MTVIHRHSQVQWCNGIIDCDQVIDFFKMFRFLSVKEAWQWKMNHLKMRLQLTKGKVEVAVFFATSFSDNFWKQETHLLMAEQKRVPLPGGEC